MAKKKSKKSSAKKTETKKVSKEEVKEKNYIGAKIIIFLIILSVLIFLYAKYIEPKMLVVKEYRITSEVIPASFSGVKIVHFSDIYYGNTTFKKDLDKVSKKINELKPDIIIFTGNLNSKNSKLTTDEEEELVLFLNSLYATTGKYIVKGSSDFNINFDELIAKTDFIHLNNSSDLIYYKGLTPIFIGGVPSISKDITDLDKVFEYFKTETEEIKKASYKIIISSEGNVFDTVLKYDSSVNLLLGSASLNGTIKIPFYGPMYIPKNTNKYYAPYYNVNGSDIFISSGLGTDNISYRFNNAPSINLYRLKSI